MINGETGFCKRFTLLTDKCGLKKIHMRSMVIRTPNQSTKINETKRLQSFCSELNKNNENDFVIYFYPHHNSEEVFMYLC